MRRPDRSLDERAGREGTATAYPLADTSFANSARIALGCPTNSTLTPYSRAANTLPSTSGRGAWSPPMASTAMVIMGIFRRLRQVQVGTTNCADRDFASPALSAELLGIVNRPALVVAAMRASPVRLLHFVAVRTLAESGSRQMVMRPASAGAPLGMASLWIWHTPTSFFSLLPCILTSSFSCFKTHTSRGEIAGFPFEFIVS